MTERGPMRSYMRSPAARAAKFLATGLLNTAFGYGVYSVLLYAGAPYFWALLASTVAGVVFNYFSFGRLVFQTDGSWLKFGRFVLAYASIYCVNVVLLTQLLQHFPIGPYMGQIMCIPANVVMSWIVMKYWVYRNNG